MFGCGVIEAMKPNCRETQDIQDKRKPHISSWTSAPPFPFVFLPTQVEFDPPSVSPSLPSAVHV